MSYSRDGSEELGTISLLAANAEYHDKGPDAEHTILIQTEGKKRVYQIRCETEAEALVWYQKIQESIHVSTPDWVLENFDPHNVVPTGTHRSNPNLLIT